MKFREFYEKTLDEKEEDNDVKILEAFGRGMMKIMPTRNPKKLEALLKKKKIPYSKDKNGNILVGDEDYDDAEELMARNLLF